MPEPRRWYLRRFGGSPWEVRQHGWGNHHASYEYVTVVELPDDCVIVRRDDLTAAVEALDEVLPGGPLLRAATRARVDRLREALDA